MDHTPSNCTRALNLWRTSGKTRYEFLKDLQQARQTTRKYQGKQAPGVRIESKMAYFFKVLESQLQGLDSGPWAASAAQGPSGASQHSTQSRVSLGPPYVF